MRWWIAVLVVAAGLAQNSAAADDWFPAELREATVHDLAERMAAVDFGRDIPEEQILDGAGSGVDALVAVIDQWGVEGVIARAPELPQLRFPATDARELAAIARYGACALGLDAVYANTGLDAEDPGHRVMAAVGSHAVVILTAFLRHHYLARDGSDDELEAYLASEEMNALSYQLQADESLLQETVNRCAPTFIALLGD